MHADLPETVYHYTDIHGVQGIYESGELWATSSRYLNDSTEATLGLHWLTRRLLETDTANLKAQNAIYRQALDDGQSVADRPGASEALAELEERSRKLKPVLDAAEDVEKYIDCFIASLSEVPDQLSQWRGYARDGYCIGFSTEKLCKALDEQYELRKVIYHDEEAATIDYLNGITAITTNLANSTTVDDEDHRAWALRSAIRFESAFVKDPRFSEEKELRIVPFGVVSPTHFTAGRYGMTPRHKITIPRDAITEVWVGPGAHKDLRGRSLVEYFHHCRVQFDWQAHPKVRQSAVPYRDW
ncbi:DUF2971 domain-containing protein [Rhodococcus daqingensis]|uniref:DUF2971 domain-containing protein n=1 Tax=Rhodococcus daqingensis TaxID=2479363 RepID=A0ABW2S5S0_9NOCA